MQQLEPSQRAAVDAELSRLESDLRVLSPVGIERAAWGWDRHEGDSLQAYHAAEREALRAIEAADADAVWNDWRRRLFFEVEGRQALVAWRAEHERHAAHVHKAERAAFGAAVGVFARPWISHARYATLVSAMAEALPWLLPERPPQARGGG
jgi:homospermidine synthase